MLDAFDVEFIKSLIMEGLKVGGYPPKNPIDTLIANSLENYFDTTIETRNGEDTRNLMHAVVSDIVEQVCEYCDCCEN